MLSLLRRCWPALFLLAACQAPQEITPPAELIQAVNARFADAAVAHPPPASVPGFFKSISLAGKTAWVADYTQIPDGRLCGTGGCPLQIWRQEADGRYRLIFDRQVLEYEFAADSGVLSLQLNGVYCSKTGAEDCTYRLQWQEGPPPAGARLALAVPGEGSQRYVSPIYQPLTVAEPASGPVAELLADYRVSCGRAGGQMDLSETLSLLPDLNGDGRAELLFDAQLGLCEKDGDYLEASCADDACGLVLFTGSENGWQRAWGGMSKQYALDLSRQSTQLLLGSKECEEDCRLYPLRWDAAAGQFHFDAPTPAKKTPPRRAASVRR